MSRVWWLALATAWGCASAAERIPDERLRISARDALLEARTEAAAWEEGATLRYVEGEGVTAEGYVAPESGHWRFVYEAPGRADQLVVTVTPRRLERATRPRQSPPGLVLGEAALGDSWVDSPQAMAAARAAGADALLAAGSPAISMLLVPLRPPQWIVSIAAGGTTRRWRINAQTGEVIPS